MAIRKSIPAFLICTLLLLIFILSCRNNYNEFSSVTQNFQDSVKGELTLCFYPSTIQMLNFENDSTFNKIFKEIKKIKVVRYTKSSDTSKNINPTLLADKIKHENYVDLLRFKQNDRDIMIFMLKHNENPKKFYGIVSDSSQIMLVDLVGNIPMKYITQLATGNFNLGGFNSVLNYNKQAKLPKNRHKQ